MEWILGIGARRINRTNAKSLVSRGEQSADACLARPGGQPAAARRSRLARRRAYASGISTKAGSASARAECAASAG